MLLFFLLLGANLFAQPAAPDVLRVGLFDQAPFVWKEGGELKGFHYEIVRGLAKKTGRPLDVTLVPLRRAIELLKVGKIDVVIMTEQAEIADLPLQKTSLLVVQTLVATMRTHKPILSKADVQGRMIRINGGCVELNDVAGLTWVNVKSYAQALDVLRIGRAEGICGTVAIQHSLKKKNLEEQIKIYPIQEKKVSLYALKSMHPKKWKALEEAAAALVADGSIQKWAAAALNPIKP